MHSKFRLKPLLFWNQKIKGKEVKGVKKITIIGVILGVGLLLTGSVAFAHWDDGDRGNRGAGYWCGSGHVARTCYWFDARAAAKDRVFCPAHRYGDRHWRSDDDRYGHRNHWMEHRGRS